MFLVWSRHSHWGWRDLFIVLAIFFQLKNKWQAFVKLYSNELTGTDKEGTIDAFLKESLTDNLKVAFSILAPLLGSLVLDLLNF